MAKNILMIACDDLNTWATLQGMYPGLDLGVDLPNIRALREMGANFSNAFCQTALCNPSRTSLLTGQTPIATGVLDNAVTWSDAVPLSNTIFDVMQAQGYFTAETGKIFHTPSMAESIRTELFDRFYLNTTNWHTDFGLPFAAGPGPFAETEHGDHLNAMWMADQIRTYSGTKPFFMAYGSFKPHSPFVAPQEFFDKFPLSEIPLPAVLEGDSSDVPPFMREQILEWFHTDILTADYWKKFVQAYLASISFMDAQIGHLLDALRTSGHDDDTMIVLFGDNGYHFGEKHMWHKFSLWGESARVPLIIVDPSAAADATRGSQIDRPVELIDLFPTMLDWALEGTGKTPAGVAPWLQGDSLKPLLRGATPLDDGVAVTLMNGSAAVTAEVGGLTYRYIRYADGSEELYDVTAGHDIREWDNLLVPAPGPAIAAVRTTMLAKLNDYASEHHLYLSNAGGTTVTGSSGKDLLVGGHAATLVGGAGDDTYHIANTGAKITESATGGIDTVYASVSFTLPSYVENGIAHLRGAGVTLIGNTLDNKLTSDLTTDTIYGRAGNDLILGLSNRDKLYGETGNDTIDGGGDDDSITGGPGNDSIIGGTGNDSVYGHAGNDTVSGGDGNDIVIGNSGLDALYDGLGLDSLYGGAEIEADRFVMTPADGQVDAIWDFAGSAAATGDKIDLTLFSGISLADLSYSPTTTILSVKAEAVVKIKGAFDIGRDVILPLLPSGEIWTGTDGADTHTGTTYDDSLRGLGGHDSLIGAAGNDTIDGGAGNDSLYGHAGNDSIIGGDGNDVLIANSGVDVIYDGSGLDSLYGGTETEADRFVLTPGDRQVDAIWDFLGSTASTGDKIDLTLFTGITMADVSFRITSVNTGILTVDGEDVVMIRGDFSLERDVLLP